MNPRDESAITPDGTRERASYLANQAPPAASGADLAPASALVDGADARSALEKRRSPRYRCQGSAQIRELETGVSTWAAFTDISLHGCYLEASSTYRIGSSLSMTIEVNGFRIETRAEVRVSYPNLGMGMFFTTMSDVDRERLRELLRSLSRPSVILGTGSSARPSSVHSAETIPAVTDPEAGLQAIVKFFVDRQILSRDEFFRILRRSQGT